MNNLESEERNSSVVKLPQQEKPYDRLRTLYRISKLLSSFDSVEETFPKMLTVAADSFPLMTAILVENWEKKPQTTVWKSANASKEQVDSAILNAREAYSSLVGDSLSEKTELKSDPASITKLPQVKETRPSNFKSHDKYIALPLIINSLPPLGVLQLEGPVSLNMEDLEFAGALTDLISVALDRYYRTKWEFEFEKKKVADLENERELRESFVTLLTHDLRTPLSAISMAGQMILRKVDNSEEIHSSAELIVNNVNRTDNMISDLLDANRIRSGEKLPLNVEAFDLVGLVQDTVKELIAIHGERFVVKSPERINGFWDRKGVRRIIENLCSNAIKYGCPDRPVTLSLEQTEMDIFISVQNWGNLITPDDQKTIFEQFKRSEKVQSSSKQGWGIGLTLVRGVAEAHDGSVIVKSVPEIGTVFTVTLPKDARNVGGHVATPLAH